MHNETDKDETPAASWATWALLQAALDKGALTPGTLAHHIAVRLRLLVDGPKMGPKAFLLLSTCGHWGRGATLTDAAKRIHQAGAGKRSRVRGVLVLNDDTPEVNEGGCIISNSDSAQFNLGHVGTVGSLMNTGDK